MRIIEDDLTHPAVQALLQEHMASMLANSPKDSTHFLDFDGLRAPDVSFWTAWLDGELAGCGALKLHDATLGEIKSMRTHNRFLRRGIAAAILSHLLNEARARGLRRVSLETGSGLAFEPAHALYYSHGFVDCDPFADYQPDPFSRYMTLAL